MRVRRSWVVVALLAIAAVACGDDDGATDAADTPPAVDNGADSQGGDTEDTSEATTDDAGAALEADDDDLDDCIEDLEAQGPGDNEGCDALYDDCAGGGLQACNLLYFSANIGSEYERFGATCGDQVEIGDDASEGDCELLLE